MALSKSALLIMFGMLLLITVVAQERRENSGWQTYSPSAASFTMQVPSLPLPPQGHIFDPEDTRIAHKIIEYGLRSRTYNFEINKGNKRWFLASILEVQTAKRRPHRFITDLEARHINSILGDEITASKVKRQATKDGEISQWSYDLAGMGDGDEGRVYVRRWGTHMIIVVVTYDWASAEDVEINAMLDSLNLRKNAPAPLR